MLHRLGHGLLVILVACLCLMPARAEASTIDLTAVSPGNFEFGGLFGADNDIALFYLSLSGTTVLSVEVTSHLESDPGFDPILTLFGLGSDFLNGYDFLLEGSDGFLEDAENEGYRRVTLSAGNYVLAVTQYSNYYAFNGGFTYDTAVNGLFTYDLFGIVGDEDVPGTPCSAFVAFDGGCRSPSFAGTLSLQPGGTVSVQPVPEPGSLTLLALGGAALLARRRRLKRPGASDVTER